MPYSQAKKDLYDSVANDVTPPLYKRNIPGPTSAPSGQQTASSSARAGLKENPDMSFVMLTDSQVVPAHKLREESRNIAAGTPSANSGSEIGESGGEESLSRQVESAKHLFEILSSRSDIDHPICAECTELLLSSLQARLNEATKERDAYVAFTKSLTKNTLSSAEVNKAQSSLASIKATESKAFADLLALEKEKADLDDEIATLEAESLTLDDDEQAFWQSRNSFALEVSRFQNERDALNAAYEHDAQQLERLQRTNVYNDAFSIGHDGPFGTINGLRLGRLPPPHSVDWSEINAAWGAAALLLVTVADKLEYTFRGFKIKPMGSTTTIEKFDYPSPQQSSTSSVRSASSATRPQSQPRTNTLDLFSSGDLPLGRMLLHRRLDAGMVAFLECLRQLIEYVDEGRDEISASSPGSTTTAPSSPGSKDLSSPRGMRLPYSIRKDKIGDVSIKLSVSTDETWTRACKYALTCCKYLLAQVSK